MFLWPDNVIFGEVVYPSGSKFGPRIQPTFEFVIVYSGEMTVTIDGISHKMVANHICLLVPGHEEIFTFALHDETWHSFCHIALSPSTEFFQRIKNFPWAIPLSQRMKALMRSGLDLNSENLTTVDELQKSLAIEMLWQFIGECEEDGDKRTNDTHHKLSEAIDYIRSNLHQPLTLTQIASHVSFSKSQLTRIFKARMDVSPIEYVWQLRVERAIELLQYTGLPIGLIAERCGFQTPNHFSRRIREVKGYSPTEIRSKSLQE